MKTVFIIIVLLLMPATCFAEPTTASTLTTSTSNTDKLQISAYAGWHPKFKTMLEQRYDGTIYIDWNVVKECIDDPTTCDPTANSMARLVSAVRDGTWKPYVETEFGEPIPKSDPPKISPK